jgi:hypothetical protein
MQAIQKGFPESPLGLSALAVEVWVSGVLTRALGTRKQRHRKQQRSQLAHESWPRRKNNKLHPESFT